MKWFSTLTSAAFVLVGPTLANLCRAENVQSGPPGYIEADRTQAEKMLGSALAGDIFSDRFTALRKRLIASSLRRSDTSLDVSRMCAGRFCCSFQQRTA